MTDIYVVSDALENATQPCAYQSSPPPCSPSPGVNVIVSHHKNQVGGELGEYLRSEV